MDLGLAKSFGFIQAVPQITNQFNSLNDVGWYGSASLLTKYV